MNKLHSRGFTGAACLLIVFCGALPAFANCCLKYNTITFSVPGAGFTRPTSINSSGAIAGVYGSSDGGTLASGFVRDPNGTITTFLGPGGHKIMWGQPTSHQVGYNVTNAGVYINDSGAVAGSYGIYNGISLVMHGFVGNPKVAGGLVSFDPPGSVYTEVRDINASGWVTGTFHDASYKYHGFVYINGTSYLIDVPGAEWTAASSVTSQDVIVGLYADGQGEHGFWCNQPCSYWFFGNLFFSGGSFNSPAGVSWMGNPIPFRSNSLGTLAGTLQAYSNNKLSGYVGNTQGNSTSFQFPGAWLTGAFGINTTGLVVGWYFVASNTHAFLRDATGSIVDIDPPGSGFAIATAINDAGVIIGVTDELGFVTTLESGVCCNVRQGP